MVLKTFIPSTAASFFLFFVTDRVNQAVHFYDAAVPEPFIKGLDDDYEN